MKTMKKLVVLLLVLPILAGCTKSNALRVKDLSYTGCATSTDTRAGEDEEIVSLLTLKYEDGNLRVTRTNTLVSCPFQDYGLVCNVSIEGNTIRYGVDAKTAPNGLGVDCLCLIEEISSLVTGLEDGKEYTFHAANSPRIEDFTFVFEKGLFRIQGK